jgi:hypothetical protein
MRWPEVRRDIFWELAGKLQYDGGMSLEAADHYAHDIVMGIAR